MLIDKKTLVPCGKCVACRIAYSREWSMRLVHEASTSGSSVFLTLTYSDEFLPLDLSLSVSSLQKFIKRLRKRFSDRLIKYFSCGEYGEKSFRPHYHLIVFGLSFNELDCYRVSRDVYSSRVLEFVWTNGFNSVGFVTPDSTRYVTDYVFKKYSGEKAKEFYGEKQIPFKLSSNGLGLSYALSDRERLELNLGLTYKGKKVGLPRYYANKLSIDKNLLRQRGLMSQVEFYEHYKEEFQLPAIDFFSWSVLRAAVSIPHRAREINLKGRVRHFRGERIL